MPLTTAFKAAVPEPPNAVSAKLKVFVPAPRSMESAADNSPAAKTKVSLPEPPLYVRVVVASVVSVILPVAALASIAVVAAKFVVPKLTLPAPVMFTLVAAAEVVAVFVNAVAALMFKVVTVAGAVKVATLLAPVAVATFKVVVAAPVVVKSLAVEAVAPAKPLRVRFKAVSAAFAVQITGPAVEPPAAVASDKLTPPRGVTIEVAAVVEFNNAASSMRRVVKPVTPEAFTELSATPGLINEIVSTPDTVAAAKAVLSATSEP